jgi:pimeloyl-ACP methyl ester carboxylesterase
MTGPASDASNAAGSPGDAAGREAFLERYDRMMLGWPEPGSAIDLRSSYGTTRVWACGPPDAPPLMLLPSYQATSAEYLALAAELAGERRILAIDMIGDAGRSTVGRTPIAGPGDMTAWLDSVLDGLELPSTELCGHSYGAWIALTYALDRPGRVSRVSLLDPTMCFAPLFPAYVLRAVPVLMKPTTPRRLSLIRWESRRKPLDAQWLDVTGSATEVFGKAPTVPTRIPSAATVSALRPSALVIVAGSTKVHSGRRVARNARRRLPGARVETIAGASHYGLPMTHAAEVARALRAPVHPPAS